MDWQAIKNEYISDTSCSYRKLVKKYGVSRTTLEKRARDEKWTELRRQTQGKTEAKLINAISKKNAKIDTKYFSLVDKLFDKANEVIANTPVWTVNSLKEMATAMKYLKECKGVKSDADMREQEARIKNLEKQAEDEVKDTTVIVQFEEDISKWSK